MDTPLLFLSNGKGFVATDFISPSSLEKVATGQWNLTANTFSCYLKLRVHNLVIPGLQSVRSEQTERRTLEMVRAGLQLSFKMSRQIIPCNNSDECFIRL